MGRHASSIHPTSKKKTLIRSKLIEDILAHQFDLVLNGFEIGGGS